MKNKFFFLIKGCLILSFLRYILIAGAKVTFLLTILNISLIFFSIYNHFYNFKLQNGRFCKVDMTSQISMRLCMECRLR